MKSTNKSNCLELLSPRAQTQVDPTLLSVGLSSASDTLTLPGLPLSHVVRLAAVHNMNVTRSRSTFSRRCRAYPSRQM